MRVPHDMVSLVGVREVVRSLHTRDGRRARARANILHGKLGGVLDQVRMQRMLGWSVEDQWLLIRPVLQTSNGEEPQRPRTLSWLMQQYEDSGVIQKRKD